MKILLCHNHYQQPGGEDQVFADEASLLESRGHNVVRYTVHNAAIAGMSRLGIASKTIWNRNTYREITEILRLERPDVVHLANTFPLISPAAYYAAREQSIPVVQSLHNYRLLCPASTFYRNGRPCEDCLGKSAAWPSVLHGCYRDSRLATGVVAAMTTSHHLLGTWQRIVDRFVALSRFSAGKFIAGGLPAEKIVVKPNFISPDPGRGSGSGGYALFVGRLAPEKGIETLLAAWEALANVLPLKIIGDGPLSSLVQAHAAKSNAVEYLGRKSADEVLRHLGEATCLVMPSEWYECCPKTLIETLAVGTPAIVSRLGAMAEMIEHETTGLSFEPGNAHELANQVKRIATDEVLASDMRRNARLCYEQKYTADANYEQLMEIYETVLVSRPEQAVAQFRQLINAPPAIKSDGGCPESETATIQWPERFDLMGVAVSATDYQEMTDRLFLAAHHGVPAIASFHAAHAIVCASSDPLLRDRVNSFQVVAPDGQPVRWALNALYDTGLDERVYGPETMRLVCQRAGEEGTPIYLYGGANQHVLDRLIEQLEQKFPGIVIAGSESPPFRPLTPEEDAAVIEHINSSGAKFVFIGLGSPKQEHFAYEHRDSIRAVQLCVGAAFDFHAGTKKMAPAWMQRRGLEWLFRLISEPRRLGRRYVTTNSIFAYRFGRQWLQERVLPRSSR